MTQHYRGSTLAIALAAALLLGACGKQEPAAPPPPKAAPPAATPAPAPPPAAAPTPPAAPVTTVASVTLGNAIGGDGKVAGGGSTVFAPKDTIYASVATNSSGGGTATIAAKWTYGEGTPVNSSEQKIEANGTVTTTFHIAKADGWPVGKYAVAISVDGKPAASTTSFEVK